MPEHFKSKLGIPRVRGSEHSVLAKSCQDIFSRRALNRNYTVSKEKGTEAGQTTNRRQEEEKVDELRLTETVNKEQSFEGKVTIENWAMTEKQRILLNISFETKMHDIYNPSFSSFDAGRHSKPVVSKLNESSSLSKSKSLESLLSGSSSHTDIQRCSSENLVEDEIREAIVIAKWADKKEKKASNQSSISSFNPDDPQTRAIHTSESPEPDPINQHAIRMLRKRGSSRLNPLEISDGNCDDKEHSGPLSPPVFNNRVSFMSREKLKERLIKNRETIENISDDDMSSELSVADEVERQGEEQNREASWLQMNDSRQQTTTKEELDKSRDGSSPAHAAQNLSKLMAKLDN